MNKIEQLTQAMIHFEQGNPKHIQHFLKVHTFSRMIAQQEHVDPSTQELIEAASLVHDIGITTALKRYGSTAGSFQEKEGPALARQILETLAYPREFIERISYLVGHHHTYSQIDGIDYQILVEADFLVNMYEEDFTKEQIQTALQQIFRTKTGCQLVQTMYLSRNPIYTR